MPQARGESWLRLWGTAVCRGLRAGPPAFGDPRIAGLGIAVGALNSTGTGRASFSNSCGKFRGAKCLHNTTRRTLGVIQTSFASPIVAGSAAVVWGAFPNKNGRQIVARLLDTANRQGVFGNSSIYGRGRLDLEAALNPIGFTSFRLESGGTAPALSSTIAFRPVFKRHRALRASAALWRTMSRTFRSSTTSTPRSRIRNPPHRRCVGRLSGLSGRHAIICSNRQERGARVHSRRRRFRRVGNILG